MKALKTFKFNGIAYKKGEDVNLNISDLKRLEKVNLIEKIPEQKKQLKKEGEALE